MGAVVPQEHTATARGVVLVAGEESVGRQLCLRSVISKQEVPGRLTEFRPESGHHRFTSNDGRDEWVSLSNRRYRWMSPVLSHARPNPTFCHFPGSHEAIGWKVRVYWNEMGRWYTGKVRAYDELTHMHEVWFFDGDERWYTLRDEAVIWVKKTRGGRRLSNGGSHEWLRNARATAPEGSETDEQQQQMKNEMQTTSTHGKPRNGKQTMFSTATSTSLSSYDTHDCVLRIPNWISDSFQSGRQLNVVSVSRSVLPSGMTLRPLKNPTHEQLIEKNPAFCILRTRVGIYWSRDHKYYRGTVMSYNEETGKYGLHYDDDQSEEIDLEKEDFKLLGPKSVTAGFSSLMKEMMVSYRAENVTTESCKAPVETTEQDLALLSRPKDVIGRRLFLYWEATGEKYEAEVLSYDIRRKLHYLWYRDGELEWVDLRRETFVWGDSGRQGKEFPAGLEEGDVIPRGKAAVGWRISVYWPDDVQFYDGRISKYDSDSDRHEIDYDDRTVEKLSLSSEKIIWRASPTTGTPRSVDSSDTASEHQKLSTGRKISRGAVNSPKPKRPRQTSPSSSDRAKENKAEHLEVSLLGDLTVGESFDLSSIGKQLRSELAPKRPAPIIPNRIPEVEEEFDVYPVVQIPAEPLPSVVHTRPAKLPAQFGAAAFQVKIVATKTETPKKLPEENEAVDPLMSCIHDCQWATAKMGRVPSTMEVTSASKILPRGEIVMEYPTKEMTGMETVALRVGFPNQRRPMPNRGRGRKKGRPMGMRKMDPDGLSVSQESVLAPFSTVSTSQTSPRDAAQSVPSVSVYPDGDVTIQAYNVDYSRHLFDAANCTKLPFLDHPSAEPSRLLHDTIGVTGSSSLTLDPSGGGGDGI